MPAITASAPGKIILFGEHAVVYGRPAIAAPVMQVRAQAILQADPRGRPGEVQVHSPAIALEARLDQLPGDHPIARAIQLVMTELQIERLPACTVRINSTIPVASGLGSGAAVSVVIIRALSAFLGQLLSDERVCALTYEVEKLHHGAPSGIDNTVITYARPVFFVRGRPLETFAVPQPFTIVIGDSGIASPTSVAVGDLRRQWQADPERYEALFDTVGRIVQTARHAIEAGQPLALGNLMNENHALLVEMGVSSPELERLTSAARQAGALGAKLSGGGRGGNMIALAHADDAPTIAQALQAAGAVRTILTQVHSR